ncbi:MAG TPA: hypothetical protein VNG93_04365 [Candidatus Dormibacteraeota bacterium]|nr:hypothetical protein [Candidatus Dormibacteraeota bacterium]
MKARLRQPLFWIVVGEVVVMFVLSAVSWRVYEARRTAPVAGLPAMARAPAPSDAVPDAGALVKPPPASQPAAQPPGGFPVTLGQINTGQGSLEHFEEGILAHLTDAMSAYLEAVALPAVKRVESEKTATNAATAQTTAATVKMA